VTIRYQRVGLKVERVPDAARERDGLLAEAEAIRDTAALLEGQVRDTRRAAQALVAGLLADHRRRTVAGLGVLGPAGHPVPARRGLATGVQLRRARVLARVSQRQLAAAWGYSRGAIAAYEDGQAPRRVPEGLSAWALQVLRASGEGPEPEGGTPE